jgi:Rps23 Pro-64 3,4-dihydroxylase Tpa1-like proline 4-hydroxylase
MAKEYSEKSFLLEIDDYSLVEQYLRTYSINDFSYTKPTGRKKNTEETVAQIETVLRKQSDAHQQEIERDFQRINNLSNEKGSQNLMAEAAEQGVTITAEQAIVLNAYDRALWFFLKHPKVFDQADAVQQFYDLNGWKRVPVPSKDTDFVASKRDALVDALKKHFTEKDARGKYGDVEMYPKTDRVYVVARLTNYAESDFIPNEETGGLEKQGTRRPLFEVYYLYRPNKGEEGGGELEIKARGGWQKQRDLLAVFTKAVFNHELDDSKQTFNLELLKDPNFTMVADPNDQMEWWWLKSLELRTPDRLTRVKITVSDDHKGGVSAMWEQLRRLNLADKVSSMLINNAEFQIKFKPTRKRQRGTATFIINWKDTCSLNNIDEFNIKACAVLKKSKLDRGFNN